MKNIKIFLASSSELLDDRKEFEIFINRINKEYIKDNIFLELVQCEDFIGAMSATRLQDEYNKAIQECDVFICLLYTKVGKYTEEEFFNAYDTFKQQGKPLVYTYFKDASIKTSKINKEMLSLLNFKQKLEEFGHFYSVYTNINELKYKFNEQLVKLLPSLTGFLQNNLTNNTDSKNYNYSISKVTGNNNMIIQNSNNSIINKNDKE
jgi:hypothetical protein